MKTKSKRTPTQAHRKRQPRLKTFNIPVTWSYSAVVPVRATTLEQARAQVMRGPLPEGNYVDDSFEILDEI